MNPVTDSRTHALAFSRSPLCKHHGLMCSLLWGRKSQILSGSPPSTRMVLVSSVGTEPHWAALRIAGWTGSGSDRGQPTLELVQPVQHIFCRMGTPCVFCCWEPKCVFPTPPAIKSRDLMPPLPPNSGEPTKSLFRFQDNSILGATTLRSLVYSMMSNTGIAKGHWKNNWRMNIPQTSPFGYDITCYKYLADIYSYSIFIAAYLQLTSCEGATLKFRTHFLIEQN